MTSKKNPGAAPAAPKMNGLPAPRPMAVVMEENDREEGIIRLAVVRLAA